MIMREHMSRSEVVVPHPKLVESTSSSLSLYVERARRIVRRAEKEERAAKGQSFNHHRGKKGKRLQAPLVAAYKLSYCAVPSAQVSLTLSLSLSLSLSPFLSL